MPSLTPFMAMQQDGTSLLAVNVRFGDDPFGGLSTRLFLASEDLQTFQVLPGKPNELGDYGQTANASSAGIVTAGIDSQGIHMHKLVKGGDSEGNSDGDTVEDNTSRASASSGGGGASWIGIGVLALLLLRYRNVSHPGKH